MTPYFRCFLGTEERLRTWLFMTLEGFCMHMHYGHVSTIPTYVASKWKLNVYDWSIYSGLNCTYWYSTRTVIDSIFIRSTFSSGTSQEQCAGRWILPLCHCDIIYCSVLTLNLLWDTEDQHRCFLVVESIKDNNYVEGSHLRIFLGTTILQWHRKMIWVRVAEHK